MNDSQEIRMKREQGSGAGNGAEKVIGRAKRGHRANTLQHLLV